MSSPPTGSSQFLKREFRAYEYLESTEHLIDEPLDMHQIQRLRLNYVMQVGPELLGDQVGVEAGAQEHVAEANDLGQVE